MTSVVNSHRFSRILHVEKTQRNEGEQQENTLTEAKYSENFKRL